MSSTGLLLEIKAGKRSDPRFLFLIWEFGEMAFGDPRVGLRRFIQ
jgi:hypothetical protein